MLSTRHEKHAVARSEVALLLASLLGLPQPSAPQTLPVKVSVPNQRVSTLRH